MVDLHVYTVFMYIQYYTTGTHVRLGERVGNRVGRAGHQRGEVGRGWAIGLGGRPSAGRGWPRVGNRQVISGERVGRGWEIGLGAGHQRGEGWTRVGNRVGGQVISGERVGRRWAIGLGGRSSAGIGWTRAGNRVGGRSSAGRGLDEGGRAGHRCPSGPSLPLSVWVQQLISVHVIEHIY